LFDPSLRHQRLEVIFVQFIKRFLFEHHHIASRGAVPPQRVRWPWLLSPLPAYHIFREILIYLTQNGDYHRDFCATADCVAAAPEAWHRAAPRLPTPQHLYSDDGVITAAATIVNRCG
jgi:hypothetical protein